VLYFAEHMGLFYSFLFPWNLVLVAIAIVHFIRRRPDTYWLWIILIGGGLGAIVYIAVEVLPDLGLLRIKKFEKKNKIKRRKKKKKIRKKEEETNKTERKNGGKERKQIKK